jgi:hypothetical protein
VGAPLCVLSACVAADHSKAVATTSRCEIRSLATVFARPVDYLGKNFCGRAIAYREPRILGIFPEGPVPQDRRTTIMFLNAKTDAILRGQISVGGTKLVYLEGELKA